MRTRVLITVTAYPLPSRSHDELVCTAGVVEDGTWIRIYPVPFRFLEYHKWQWVELDLIPHDPGQDFRPESRRPQSYELEDLQIVIDKIPYKFKYQFTDDEGRESTMTIEDWEIGALYRNCLAAAEGDEDVAIDKVRQKYETEFLEEKAISLFLGTTLKHHRARHTNPFTIVGVFYPPRNPQGELL